MLRMNMIIQVAYKTNKLLDNYIRLKSEYATL